MAKIKWKINGRCIDKYYVMGRWIDDDDWTSDDNFIIESYYAKEKAFKLRDLLNELTEMDVVYFVELNGKEIKIDVA